MGAPLTLRGIPLPPRADWIRWLKRTLRWAGLALAIFHAYAFFGLLYVKWFPPLYTSVQIQQRVEAWWAGQPFEKRTTFVPLEQISDHLEHAVVAAEDTRFYTHWGFDFDAMQEALAEYQAGGRLRGGSTLTQQLVKNLFLTTHRSYLRKAFEFTLTPLAELLLSKERILELYLNTAEWGYGVYGAEAAAQMAYQKPAQDLSRQDAARLAACLPAPRRRVPQRMVRYGNIILQRMRTLGW